MRQVEFTESYKVGAETYEAGDRKTFEDGEAATYIKIGVAKCVETGEQGDRKPGAHVLEVQDIEQSV